MAVREVRSKQEMLSSLICSQKAEISTWLEQKSNQAYKTELHMEPESSFFCQNILGGCQSVHKSISFFEAPFK